MTSRLRIFVTISLAIASTSTLSAAPPLRPQINNTHYTIHADLDPATGRLSATASVTFTALDDLNLITFGLNNGLQLTNITRDIKEDLGNGRVYLPAEYLDRFGCTLRPSGPDGQPVMVGDLGSLIRFEAKRAQGWYSTGLRLIPLLDRRSGACTGAMAGIYARLLDHIYAAPQDSLDHRMSLPTSQKALVAASALAGMARRPKLAAGAA